MAIVTPLPGPMSPKSQSSVSDGGAPVMAQAPTGTENPPVPVTESRFQSTPSPAGSASVRVTSLATPVPTAPLFDSAIVKPIGSPAVTVAASAVFSRSRSGANVLLLNDTLPAQSGRVIVSTWSV